MKAAVLYELGKPLRVVDDVDVPAVQRGQVKVRLAYSGVCHSQLMEVRGRRGQDPYLPHLLGHEGSGVVTEIGAEVSKVRPGDRVILGWIKGSGLDVSGPRYRRGEETLSAGAVTTFNEYAVVSENRCTALPDGVPMDVAVLFGCALPTGAGIVTNSLQPTPGSTVAVFGLGGIGLSAMMACRLYGCSKIIAVDVAPDKLELADALGATSVVDASRMDPVEEVRRLTGGKGADYSVEAAGSAATIEQAFDSVRRGGGLCIFASHPPQNARISLDPYELICGKRIAGSWGGASNPDRDVPRFADLYCAGKLPLEKLITRRYRLDDINSALDDLEQHRVGRPIIEIGPSGN
jgi:S-(hydroxymethyl)glutathione dehydrogenase / alcohol dehydrogenase